MLNNPNLTELSQSQVKQLDYLVFTSSSGVHGFFQGSDKRELLKNTKIVSIGDATKKTLNEYGYNIILTAREASVNGIVECITEDDRNSRGRNR